MEYTEEFAGASNTEELLDCLFEIIPINREKLNNIQVKGSIRKLKASFKCNLIKEAELKSFVSSYTQLSNETLRQNSSPHHLSEKNSYSEAFYYRCHHKT